ncbi:hypothetical protein F4774DRAFT_417487 [Daldinia eschscholtzii]|nr:hypothetical protein F4774DRAFT_417487 [Daldinia eschscholtzii]
MSSKSLILCLLAPLVAGFNLSVPAPTGPFAVGTTVLEITDYSRLDPFAPTPQPRKLAVSLFYPTDRVPKNTTSCQKSNQCTRAVQLPPHTAAAIETQAGVPTGILHSIITQACQDAPVTQPLRPLLLFNPGRGASRLIYSDSLIEIASYGFTLASVDHPYESNVVEYPDGSVVYGLQLDDSLSTILKLIDIRAADLRSVLNAFSNSTVTDKIPGYGPLTKFKTDKVGVFGHSLGGATALQVVANDTRFAAGLNVDGSFWGAEQQIGTEAPFMVVAAEGHNRTSDESWAATWPNLRGFKREATVKGTEHNSFTDTGLFVEMLEELGGGVPVNITIPIGTIKGTRITALQRALLTSFFKRTLDGENDGLLDGAAAEEWPEVSFQQ